MKRFVVCLTVFFLALFLSTSSTHAHWYKKKVRITSVKVDQENGMIYISGAHFGKRPIVKLGEYRLTVMEEESTNTWVAAVLPSDLEDGTYRLQVMRRRHRRWYPVRKATMDITIEAPETLNGSGNPGPLDPPGDPGDTIPPTITYNAPTSIKFDEPTLSMDLTVEDDNELAFLAIQHDRLTINNSTNYIEPGISKKDYSLQLEASYGLNKFLIVASDVSGNVGKAVVEVDREKDCPSCDLTGARLNGMDLSGADMSYANLFGADLSDTKFVGTNLSYAQLLYTYLFNADLTNADLTYASLYRAKLKGANLTGADMTGADLTLAQWDNTTCPDGTNSNDNGDTCLGHLTPTIP